MNKKIIHILLLAWYVASLFLVAADYTLSLQLKITGEIINLLFIGIIAENLLQQKAKNISYYLIVSILLVWYLYYTPLDFLNKGYTIGQHYGYTIIDIVSIIYLVRIQLFFCFESVKARLIKVKMI